MEPFTYYPFPADTYGYQPNIPGQSPLFEDDFCETDMEYMKRLYPKPVRQIQREVEEQCDKLEYEGSCMFDQYPDAVHIRMIAGIIYENLGDLDTSEAAVKEMNLNLRRPCGPGGYCPQPNPCYFKDGTPDWRCNLIETMLFHEMMHRRRRYHNRKRWF